MEHYINNEYQDTRLLSDHPPHNFSAANSGLSSVKLRPVITFLVINYSKSLPCNQLLIFDNLTI